MQEDANPNCPTCGGDWEEIDGVEFDTLQNNGYRDATGC